MNNQQYTIAAFYKFFANTDLQNRQTTLINFMKEQGIFGTILLASEGINSTLAGSDQAVQKLLALLRSWDGLADLEVKFSYADEQPFRRIKVKIKSEIVTLRDQRVNPLLKTGHYVSPEEWNRLLEQPDVIVLDTRNDYEYAIGTFANALNPDIEHFVDFKDFVKENLADQKDKKIAMFCTGGIRCEKASGFMTEEGFSEVYQLHGGILKYIEEVKAEDSKWNGECYVFDERRAVDSELNPI